MGLLDFFYEFVPGVRTFHTRLNQLTNSYVPPPPVPDPGAKRRVLLVTTHTVPESFSLAIAKTVEDTAREEGHEVKRIDLGLEGFSPSLTEQEHRSYMCAPEQLGGNNKALPADVAGCIEKLKWCDTLFFVYPTWWMSTPANLKGFFDRTLRLHYTWDLPDQASSSSLFSRILPPALKPGLVNIERVFGISTYGASWPVVLASGDNGRNTIARPIMAIMNPDCTLRWHGLYEVDFTTLSQRQTFLEEVRNMVRKDL